MTAAQFEDLRTDEAAEVLAWRFDALCRSGFDLDAAAVLAANVEVDLHRAIELVGRGCPPELVVDALERLDPRFPEPEDGLEGLVA